MKTYRYVAAGPGGAALEGEATCASEQELDRELERDGLVLIRARAVARPRPEGAARLSPRELSFFANQLATLLAAGIPIVRAIASAAPRMRTRGGRAVLEHLVRDLRGGRPLSEAFERQSASFPPLLLASVRAGELSGQLPRILRRVAAHLEWTRSIRATTLQALVYPAILCLAIVALIVVLLTFLLPRIVGLFPGGRADLPLQTRIVVAASDFLTGYWPALLCGLALVVGGSWLALRREPTRLALSRALLRVPRLGELVRMLASARFAATAGTLHAAGADVFRVFENGAETCGNAWLRSRFLAARERILGGATIAESLESQPEMDPLLIQIASVGEQSGDLGTALERLSEHYDQEVPRTVKLFLSLLEPCILLVAGGVVAFILLAALLPVLTLYDNLR